MLRILQQALLAVLQVLCTGLTTAPPWSYSEGGHAEKGAFGHFFLCIPNICCTFVRPLGKWKNKMVIEGSNNGK